MNQIALPLDEKTIAHYLSDAGYEVGYIGKWHLASTGERYARQENRLGQREPFRCETTAVPTERRGGYVDYWLASDVLEYTSHGYGGHMYDGEMNRVDFPLGRYRVDAQTDFAIEYLRTRTQEKPFFVLLSYIEPHWQNDSYRHDTPQGAVGPFKAYNEPGDLVGTSDKVAWLKNGWRSEYPRYLACVNSLDSNIGRIRNALTELGLADNTLIIYTSDHGCHFGQRNEGAKDTCHDASLRVPLIFNGPGFCGGRVIANLVSLLDLPPTILAAAGVGDQPGMHGRQIQQLLSTSKSEWLDEIFYQISPAIIGRGIRTRKWKFAVRAPDMEGWDQAASELYVPDFLYDLDEDPHERHNVVADARFRGIIAQLAERLRQRMVLANEPPFEIRLAW